MLNYVPLASKVDLQGSKNVISATLVEICIQGVFRTTPIYKTKGGDNVFVFRCEANLKIDTVDLYNNAVNSTMAYQYQIKHTPAIINR